MSLLEYTEFFGDTILDLTIKHILLFGVSFIGASILGVAIGVVSYRFSGLRFLTPVVNILQATPEIVLLAISIPFLGIGYVGALVPLFIKGILPIMQNTTSGLAGVDPNIKEAARGMGMSELTVLLRVELINAAPVILAGMRVSAVMLVSVITLTAYIGVESLGTLILQGIARMDANPLLIGSGLSAILAIAVNQAIVIVENLAMRRVGVRS
ncbi:MAG: ABC transporter permease [Rhizobiaceae bacterium]|nr:ABC transporter permease [Rhizobiaceae bacterium]